MSFSAFTGAPSLKLAWDEPPEIDAKMGDGVGFSPLLVVPTHSASAINNELTALSPDPHPIGAADSASIHSNFFHSSASAQKNSDATAHGQIEAAQLELSQRQQEFAQLKRQEQQSQAEVAQLTYVVRPPVCAALPSSASTST